MVTCSPLLALVLMAAAPDVAVVCPASFVPSLQPWIAHREGQGHSVELLDNQGTSDDIRGRLRDCAKQGSLKFVLLVGDTAPIAGDPASATAVPLVEAKVNVRFGSEPSIATDNPYADLDDDGLPDVAIGRLTADSPRALSQLVAKILAYEKSRDFGPWRGRIHFVAGTGGFGPLTDAVIEGTTRRLIGQELPPEYECRLTYAEWHSPFCPAPPRFGETTLKGLNEGCLFWVYMGHAHCRGLDYVFTPEHEHPILEAHHTARLRSLAGHPIAILLACHAGEFDADEDSLAEEMLRAPEGPVAVLASSRVAMPYGMAVLASALAEQYVGGERTTLGELVLAAKRETLRPSSGGARRAMLDLVARAVSPAADAMEDERREHVALFNLLGDPLLRLPRSEPIAIEELTAAVAGSELTIHATSPLAGGATIELVVPRGQLREAAPRREKYSLDREAQEQMQRDYESANDARLASTSLDVKPGPFHAAISIPRTAAGRCYVRVFVQGTLGFALGATSVEIRRPVSDAISAEPVDVKVD